VRPGICTGFRWAGVLGGGNVVDMVMLATLITGPLTKEINITVGTNLHTLVMLWKGRVPDRIVAGI
jgi:hypothetical protein